MDNKLLFPSATLLLDNDGTGCKKATVLRSEFSSFPDISSDAVAEELVCTGEASSFSPVPLGEVSGDCEANCRYLQSSYSEWESGDSLDYKKKKKSRKKKKKRKSKNINSLEFHKQHDNKLHNKPNTIWLHETQLDYTEAFREDRRSDQKNLEFDSLYVNDIAKYSHSSLMGCLGLGKRQSFILYSDTKKRRKRRTEEIRYFLKTSIYFEDHNTNNKFINEVESEDFIPVVNQFEMKIEDKGTYDSPTGDSIEIPCLKKNRYFLEQLSEDPSDINMWLAYVDYQDESNGNYENLATLPKATIEKKMCILEKAMNNNPLSEELIVKYMNLANRLWPHEMIREKWKHILFTLPNLSKLWQHYLLYIQSNVLDMKVSSVLAGYRSCFRMLIGIYNGTVRTHSREEDAEEGLLVTFLQMVIFLWQAGLTEKSLCLMQCMLEFNIFCPHQFVVENDHKEKLSAFEVFFETAEPRYGESGANGWNRKLAHSDNAPQSRACLSSLPTTYSTCIDYDFDDQLEKLKERKSSNEAVWLTLENIRIVNEIFSYRLDENECEDTERIILFDDIAFALFSLSSLNLKFQLLLVYLLLIGLPLPSDLINDKVFNCISLYFLINQSKECYSCFCHAPMFNNYVSIDSLLFNKSNLPNLKTVQAIRLVLSQSLITFQSIKAIQIISQLWFHFESVLLRHEFERSEEFGKEYALRKFGKCLLKLSANRSCTVLWNMYAMHRWNTGNVSEATNIFATVIEMCLQDGKETVFNVSAVIRVLVDIHLEWRSCETIESISPIAKQKISSALLGFISSKYLSHASEEVSTSPVLLKLSTVLKRAYSTALGNEVNNQSIKDFLCCYSVYIYIFCGVDSLIQFSNEIMDTFFYASPQIDISDVLCYILLILRCETGIFKLYKQLLEQCYKVYYKNPILIKLFNALMQHGWSSYKTRTFYEGLMDKECDIQPWLSAIVYEQNRLKHVTLIPSIGEVDLEFIDGQTGIHSRIRSLYQRALVKHRFKHCSDLWTNFLLFQLKYGSKKHASDTLCLALKNCPGVKSLHLFGCEKLGKFEEMYSLLEEKELRVKVIKEELELLMQL